MKHWYVWNWFDRFSSCYHSLQACSELEFHQFHGITLIHLYNRAKCGHVSARLACMNSCKRLSRASISASSELWSKFSETAQSNNTVINRNLILLCLAWLETYIMISWELAFFWFGIWFCQSAFSPHCSLRSAGQRREQSREIEGGSFHEGYHEVCLLSDVLCSWCI